MQGGDWGQEAARPPHCPASLLLHPLLLLLFLQFSSRAHCVGYSKCDRFNPSSGGWVVVVVVVVSGASGVAAFSRCSEFERRTGHSRCGAACSTPLSAVRVCVWEGGGAGMGEGLLSLVLTAVSARSGGAARSRRIGFLRARWRSAPVASAAADHSAIAAAAALVAAAASLLLLQILLLHLRLMQLLLLL